MHAARIVCIVKDDVRHDMPLIPSLSQSKSLPKAFFIVFCHAAMLCPIHNKQSSLRTLQYSNSHFSSRKHMYNTTFTCKRVMIEGQPWIRTQQLAIHSPPATVVFQSPDVQLLACSPYTPAYTIRLSGKALCMVFLNFSFSSRLLRMPIGPSQNPLQGFVDLTKTESYTTISNE